MRFILILTTILLSTTIHAQVIKRNYTGFTPWIDCSKRGPVMFEYRLGKDTGNFKRGRCKKDAQVDDRCEPISTRAYSTSHPKVPTTNGIKFDRGHLVPINHMDSTRASAADSNHMVNIMPQTKALNRGAWAVTEVLAECYREQGTVWVIGGVYWGNDKSNDFFVASHGLTTPDGYWKVMIRGKDVNAWFFANSPDKAKVGKKTLDDHLVSVQWIEGKVGITVPIPESLKAIQPGSSFVKPKWCKGKMLG